MDEPHAVKGVVDTSGHNTFVPLAAVTSGNGDGDVAFREESRKLLDPKRHDFHDLNVVRFLLRAASMKTRDISLVALCALVWGCGTGGFDQASITGECDGNLACGVDLASGPLAVGASMELRPSLSAPGSGLPAIVLHSANAEVLEAEADTLTGLGEGMSAVIIADENGLALDFFHVFVELPDHLQLARVGDELSGADIDGPIELLAGDEIVLTTRPAKGSQPLAGNAAAVWASESPAVTILADGDPARRRIVARTTGTASISIESMGLRRELTLHVLP